MSPTFVRRGSGRRWNTVWRDLSIALTAVGIDPGRAGGPIRRTRPWISGCGVETNDEAVDGHEAPTQPAHDDERSEAANALLLLRVKMEAVTTKEAYAQATGRRDGSATVLTRAIVDRTWPRDPNPSLRGDDRKSTKMKGHMERCWEAGELQVWPDAVMERGRSRMWLGRLNQESEH